MAVMNENFFFNSASVSIKFAPDEEKKKAALEKFNPKLDAFIKNIEKILEENGGEWLVGKDFTWADLCVAIALHQVMPKCNFVLFYNSLIVSPFAVDQSLCRCGVGGEDTQAPCLEQEGP